MKKLPKKKNFKMVDYAYVLPDEESVKESLNHERFHWDFETPDNEEQAREKAKEDCLIDGHKRYRVIKITVEVLPEEEVKQVPGEFRWY